MDVEKHTSASHAFKRASLPLMRSLHRCATPRPTELVVIAI
jgi:hypothetical protein